jgi:hypothetical protein
MEDDLWARINAIKSSLQGFKATLCKHCKQQKPLNERQLCDDCQDIQTRKLAEAKNTNDKGYIYIYDDTGKMVSESRSVMEQVLGRKLRSHEVVLRRDNRRDNNSATNLVLGLRNGTPLGNLRCNHCGTQGDFILIVEEEASEAPD